MTTERTPEALAALRALAEHALPTDAPGAWIRDAVAALDTPRAPLEAPQSPETPEVEE